MAHFKHVAKHFPLHVHTVRLVYCTASLRRVVEKIQEVMPSPSAWFPLSAFVLPNGHTPVTRGVLLSVHSQGTFWFPMQPMILISSVLWHTPQEHLGKNRVSWMLCLWLQLQGVLTALPGEAVSGECKCDTRSVRKMRWNGGEFCRVVEASRYGSWVTFWVASCFWERTSS